MRTSTATESDRLLTTDELAERLGVSVSTVRRCVRRCEIPTIRIRGCVRFRFDEVVEALGGQDPMG